MQARDSDERIPWAVCGPLEDTPPPKEDWSPSKRPPSWRRDPKADPPQPIPPTEPARESTRLDLLLQLREKFGVSLNGAESVACLDMGEAKGNRSTEKEDAD